MSKSNGIENLIKQAEAVNCRYYDLSCHDVLFLAKACDNNFINGSVLLFKIGFLKGQRAEKARQKKKRQSTIA